MKRALIVTAVLLVLVFLLRFWWQDREEQSTPGIAKSGSATASNSPGLSAPGASSKAGASSPEIDGPIVLANDLNRPDGTIAQDLRILENLLDAWRTNFPHNGNPWGENAEIAAGLSGQNPLHLVLIPRTHIAFNPAGELCDRWGTPFRFHALSSTQMEVRSAGPDKKFGTADDANLAP